MYALVKLKFVFSNEMRGKEEKGVKEERDRERLMKKPILKVERSWMILLKMRKEELFISL